MSPSPRIIAVDAWPVRYVEPNDHDGERFLVLVRLTAEDGSVGWGEAVTLMREAALATAVLVRGLAPVVTGLPAAPGPIATALKAHTWWYGEGGLATFALAALDLAAWDVSGHVSGRSVVDLCGGPVQDGLPVVVTGHATLPDVRAEADRFAGWVSQLHARGTKVGFGKRGKARLGFEHARDVAFVAALRAALGDEPWLMVDIGVRNRWTLPEAVRRIRAFEHHELHWIEEPLGARDPAGYAELRRRTNTLIAYGEREWTTAGYQEIVDSGTVDVVGVDAGRAEGLSGFLRVARIVEAARRQVNAHAFAGPLSYAAGLAGSLLTPACHQFEVAPLVNSAVRDFAPALPRPVGGRVTALPGPGLGVEIDTDAVVAAAVA